jgi:hypothetical protein
VLELKESLNIDAAEALSALSLISFQHFPWGFIFGFMAY